MSYPAARCGVRRWAQLLFQPVYYLLDVPKLSSCVQVLLCGKEPEQFGQDSLYPIRLAVPPFRTQSVDGRMCYGGAEIGRREQAGAYLRGQITLLPFRFGSGFGKFSANL